MHARQVLHLGSMSWPYWTLLSYILLKDKASLCILGWLRNCYGAHSGLKPPTLRSQAPNASCWDYRHVPPYMSYCLTYFFLFPLAGFVLEIPRMRFKKNTSQSLTCLRITGILLKHGFSSYSRLCVSKRSPHRSTLELFSFKIQVIITCRRCSLSSEDSKGEVTLMARVCGWLKYYNLLTTRSSKQIFHSSESWQDKIQQSFFKF